IQSLSGPGFSTIPSALDQGAIDPATLRSRAAGWGRELASAGVNLNFAPVLDVVPPGTDAQNEPIGALRRGYGHDPAPVSAPVIRQMLHVSLGFIGVVVSDDLGATVAVANIPAADRAIGFLVAGGDLIISKTVAPANAMAGAIAARVSSDAAFKARVDDAALRVIRAKMALGLVRCS